MAKLTQVQRDMLEAESFHIDGWTSERGREAAADLERRGFVKSYVSQGEQYTAINFTITDAGRAALKES